ncbi:hypothetical protein, partial [Xanthomonas fragariae]
EPTNNAEQQNVGEAITLANNASEVSTEQTPEGVSQDGGGKADDKLTATTQPTTSQQQTDGASAVANAKKKLAIVVKAGGRVATMGRGGKVEVIFKDTGDVAVIELASLEIVGTEVIKHENV